MNNVAIYMEGGGDSRDTEAALRQGMDAFLSSLKEAARAKAWRWKLVCCGGRREAFKAVRNACAQAEATCVVLLVDAEAPVTTPATEHLRQRDGWDFTGIEVNAVELMTQTMEAWIVADADALGRYYGPGFNAGALPKAANLETVAKSDVASALTRATQATRKGEYHKIRHASDLLQRIVPGVVFTRCPACQQLFDDVGNRIAAV